MMSAAASFPQYETKVIEPVGDEIASEGVGDETQYGAAPEIPSPTWNLHTTQPKYFAPT